MKDKLILLKRKNPVTYEIHRFEIKETKNLVLTTTDLELAERIVNSYNRKPSSFENKDYNILLKLTNKLIKENQELCK